MNGSVAGTAETPSVEALLFKSGAISADQLGELVRDSVLTHRPVAALAVERGLVTEEMVAALAANAEEPRPVDEPQAEVVPVPQPAAPAVLPVPEPVLVPQDVVATEIAEEVPIVEEVPAPAAPEADVVAPAFELVVPRPRLAPAGSLDERVQAAVAQAAQTPAPVPSPVVPLPQPETDPLPPAAEELPAAAVSFMVLARLQSGERVPVESASTYEQAVELARSLAGRLASAAEWPLLAGRCIRPESIVSVDIERALES